MYINLRGEQLITYCCSSKFKVTNMKLCVFVLICLATVCFSVPLENTEADHFDLKDVKGCKKFIVNI